jgi:hypothetical protein
MFWEIRKNFIVGTYGMLDADRWWSGKIGNSWKFSCWKDVGWQRNCTFCTKNENELRKWEGEM